MKLKRHYKHYFDNVRIVYVNCPNHIDPTIHAVIQNRQPFLFIFKRWRNDGPKCTFTIVEKIPHAGGYLGMLMGMNETADKIRLDLDGGKYVEAWKEDAFKLDEVLDVMYNEYLTRRKKSLKLKKQLNEISSKG